MIFVFGCFFYMFCFWCGLYVRIVFKYDFRFLDFLQSFQLYCIWRVIWVIKAFEFIRIISKGIFKIFWSWWILVEFGCLQRFLFLVRVEEMVF